MPKPLNKRFFTEFRGMTKPREGHKKIAHGASRGVGARVWAGKPRRGDRSDQTANFRPAGAEQDVCRWAPTADAVGYVLTPLRG